PQLQVFREHTNQSLRQQCRVWPEALWIGLPARTRECRINGQTVESTDVMCRPGLCDFELVTPESFDIFGIVIKQQELNRVAAIQGIALHTDGLLEHPRLRSPMQTLSAMRFLVNRLLGGGP